MVNDVRAIVRGFFAERGKSVPEDTTDLFETEIIDSMELMELLLHMEEQHGISVPQDLMTVDNFRTINVIVGTVTNVAR